MVQDHGDYDYESLPEGDFDYAQGPEYGASPDLVPTPGEEYVTGGGEAPEPGPLEHQSMMTHGVQNDVYAAPMPQRPRPPQHAMPMHAQAVGQAPSDGTNSLGASLLAVGVGGALGGKYGGWAGAGAGILFAGAAINALRAVKGYKGGSDEGNKEGRVSAFYTLVGAGAGGLLWYKYADKKKMTRNPADDTDDDNDFEMPCGIRPVGP